MTDIGLMLHRHHHKCLNNMTVELIDKCMRNMRKGKACGPDDLRAEHLIYAHPALVLHLRRLFLLSLQHAFVPHSFSYGISIPLIKDKTGSLNNVDNYRAITLSPIISKLFEMSVLDICNDALAIPILCSLVSKPALVAQMLFSLSRPQYSTL